MDDFQVAKQSETTREILLRDFYQDFICRYRVNRLPGEQDYVVAYGLQSIHAKHIS